MDTATNTRKLPDLLGLLAEEASPGADQGARDFVASALLAASIPGGWSEFAHASAALESIQFEIVERAERIKGSELKLRGNLQKLPLLGLCAAIHKHGFGFADGHEARRLLFCTLVELVAFGPEVVRDRRYRKLATGLRALIERQSRNPEGGVSSANMTVWELFDWISESPAYPEYMKLAWAELKSEVRKVLWSGAAEIEQGKSGQADTEPQLVVVRDGETVWVVPEGTAYQPSLPEALQEELLAKTLTRVTALNRYSTSSLLVVGDADMKVFVRKLMGGGNDDGQPTPHELAQLLSIATGVPVKQVYGIGCREFVDQVDLTPAYPGVISRDGRWLVRSEFDPRPQTDQPRTFQPRTIHIPIPPSLANHLASQAGGLEVGRPAIRAPSFYTRPSSPRAESIWFTTLVSRLIRHRFWGVSIAQHALHSSFGLDEAPLFYDRIPTDEIAHSIAQATHPWFGDPPRPAAKGLPTHRVGSQRVVDGALISSHLAARRSLWHEGLHIWERISHRAIHLFDGLCLSVSSRVNESMADIRVSHISANYRLICIGDKAVSLDHLHRLAALPIQWIKELQAYLGELEHAVKTHPASALAEHCERALAGTGPLLISAASLSDCEPLSLVGYRASQPEWAQEVSNFGRHYLNDRLATRLPEPLRVAQLGWSGTREGAFSSMATCSVLEACDQISCASGEVLKEIGWRPLPTVHLPECALEKIHVGWRSAENAHLKEFHERSRRRLKDRECRMWSFAEKIRPAVNAFFNANEVPLEATESGLMPKAGGGSPVSISRSMQLSMLMSMGVAEKGCRDSAKELLYAWLTKSRAAGTTQGPLPPRVAHQLPRVPGPFLRECPVALDHHDAIWQALMQAELTMPARVFVAVLLQGWLPNAELVVALMAPGARLYDLQSPDSLLIEPSTSPKTDAPCPGGCLALSGAAALALRAWHRGRCVGEVSVRDLEVELHATLRPLLVPGLTVGEIIDELEALARARASLVTPGVVRNVAVGRVVPMFAGIERVIALHENRDVISQPAGDIVAGQLSTGGVQKQRREAASGAYARVKDLIRHAAERWHPSKDRQLRSDLIGALHAIVPSEHPVSAAELLALYAAAYLSQGVKKEHVKFNTVLDAVYAVGDALMTHLPDRFDHGNPEMWEATYLRAIHGRDAAQRPDLAHALLHFHRVMHRDYSLAVINADDMLDACGVPQPPRPVGFLRQAEEQATYAILQEWLEEAERDGNWQDVVVARNDIALAACAFCSSLRDREITVPRWMDVKFHGSGGGCIELRAHGTEGLKTINARRRVELCGGHGPAAIAALQDGLGQREALRGFSPSFRVFNLNVHGSIPLETGELTSRINRALRHVVGDPLVSIGVTRKTWALKHFRAIPRDLNGDLWPTRNFLAAIGQASITTTQGHYIHDPVSFSCRVQDPGVSPGTAAWVLGMSHRCARRLITKPESWLKAPDARLVIHESGMASAALSGMNYQHHFDLTPSDIESALNMVGLGASPDAAARAIGWPRRYKRAFCDALHHVREQRLTIDDAGRGEPFISTPRSAGRGMVLAECHALCSCWPTLEWMCAQWLPFSALEIEGIPATKAQWDARVPEDSPIARLNWVQGQARGLPVYALARRAKYKQSPWWQFRWLMLAAYVRRQMQIRLDSS